MSHLSNVELQNIFGKLEDSDEYDESIQEDETEKWNDDPLRSSQLEQRTENLTIESKTRITAKGRDNQSLQQ